MRIVGGPEVLYDLIYVTLLQIIYNAQFPTLSVTSTCNIQNNQNFVLQKHRGDINMYIFSIIFVTKF